MGISIGSLNISKLYFGNREISKIYFGNSQIYTDIIPLPAPNIFMSDSNLIVEDVEHAVGYEVYDNNTLIATLSANGGN